MSRAMQLKARIRNIAEENNIPAQAVLQNYMLERLLERIVRSPYRDRFVLKGGMLIASLVGIDSRTTMDMDTTLKGYPLTEDALQRTLSDICAVELEDDVTLTFNQLKLIRPDDEYGGYRASVTAQFETIQTALKIDITTGDVITPAAVLYTFPSLFERKVFEVWAYPTETILAEKIETILQRGVLNTRPRDFYDVYILLRTQRERIDGRILIDALTATCQKRLSTSVLDDRDNILSMIQNDAVMRDRWERYSAEYPYAHGISFDEVIGVIRDMLPAD